MERGSWRQAVACSLLLLFFLQTLADFIEAVYAFGLHSTGLVLETWAILFLLSPFLLCSVRRGLPGWAVVLLCEAVVLCRVLEPMFATRGRMLVAGLGAACFLLMFPALLWNRAASPAAMGTGLTLAVALSILFRVLNSGLDISTWAGFQAIGWVLGGVAAVFAFEFRRGESQTPSGGGIHGASPNVFGPCLGVMAALVLIHFGFMSPGVIARWAEANHLYVISLLAVSLALFLWLVRSPGLVAVLGRSGVLWAGNLAFLISLVTLLYMQQIGLPDDPARYPLYAPPPTPLRYVPLTVLLLSFPIVLWDFLLFTHRIAEIRPSFRSVTLSFALASIWLPVMIFAHILTSVYDYVPVIGPLFRDQFWLVYLAAGLALVLPALCLGKGTSSVSSIPPSRLWPLSLSVIALLTIGGAWFTTANPAPQPGPRNAVKIFTYNIQQGYSEDGVRNFDGQLALLREADPDILGLQESDTNRIAGGNCDVVRYYADKLNMYSYYGPTPVTGTFGVALLSKYPIRNPETFFLYSHGPRRGRHVKEQTAAIRAEITVGEKTFTVVVTHLGNRGPIFQQQAVLAGLRGAENAVVMGDFNFRPGSDAYQFTTQSLDDSWVVYGGGNVEGREADNRQRIDHIFVSPGTKIAASRYLNGPQSDHPALETVISW
jgi:endonuclease/exonuclease/phosphatase family metal-dependent hydrolase